jgi:hypothetical protein
MQTSRRDLLKTLVASSAVSLLLPQAHGQTYPEKQPDALPAGTLNKFNPDGSVHPFAGNTVISHLPAQCALRDATVALHDAMLAAPFHARFAALPTDSYHMTVFSGVNDQGRGPASWPSDIPIDTPIEECTRILNGRLASFKTACPMPLRMKIDPAATNVYTGGCSLRLVPADEAANRNIRTLRDQLAEVFRFRAADHATYEFHITIAYSLGQLSAPNERAYRVLLAYHVARIASAVPIIELGLPEFCSFRDMYRYDLVRYLQTI